MNKKFTKLIAAAALLVFMAPSLVGWGQTPYTQLTSIADIDETAQYVLGIDGTGFHYTGTSSWGKTALPSAQTPIYYTLTKAADGSSFTAQATIDNTTYYLQVPTTNTFSMVETTSQNPTNIDLIIGTTQVSSTNYAVANKNTTARHLRINGTSGLRSYAGTTGTMAFFYKYTPLVYHTLTITQPTGGTIAVTDAQQQTVQSGASIAENAVLTLTATPAAGYVFTNWTTTSGALAEASANPTTFTMGTQNAEISAVFTQDVTNYNVSTNMNIANGSISADPTSCISGTVVTLTITPDNGYHIETLTVTGDVSGDAITISPALSPTVNEYTFNMPAENVTVNGTFTNTFTDELTAELIGVTTYSNWSGKTSNSSAVYAGNSTKNYDAIQLRKSSDTQDPSGIVTTTSGGIAKEVVVTWNSNTVNGRTLNVYGKNKAYTSAADLYDDATAGTLIGTIVKGTSTELTISSDYLFIGLCSASGAMYLDEIEITWEIDNNPAVPTTVTINASGITNTNVYLSTEAGALSATVKDNQDNIINATVTWGSSDTDVATINENGAITLVAAGTTTITASYAGVENQYRPSSATYELTVISVDPNALGGQNNPYTVAQAIEAINAGGNVSGVYATGIVTQNDGHYYSTGNHYYTYFITDDGDSNNTQQLEAFHGMSFNGDPFNSVDDIQVGDIVVIYGDLTIYNTTYEFTTGNQLVSLSRPSTNEITINDIIIETGETYTVHSGTILELVGTPNILGNLIIEDGGQLVHNSDVEATLQKDITGYSKGGKAVNGWYTIASPVDGEPVTTLTTGSYDLYSYKESEHKWYNQKAHTTEFTTLSRGIGYLYANSAAKVVSFAGSMKATNAELAVALTYTDAAGALKGANLVGNPFTRNLVAGDIKVGGTELASYLVVESGEELTVSNISTNPIKPGQGFFVQIPETHSSTDIVFNPPTSKGETAAKPAFVCIEAGDATFMDRAYVQIGQGNTLRKMSINEEVPHLYVLNKEADYAAATIEAAEGEMPVCFAAAQNGQYTITVNAVGVETDYLHLVDNLTGADIDLLQTPEYSFSAKTTDNPSRFRLMFNAGPSTGDQTDDEPFAYYNGSEWVVSTTGEASMQLIDMMGRIVSTHQINGTQSVSTEALASGVYVMRLVNGTNVKTQKIVVR